MTTVNRILADTPMSVYRFVRNKAYTVDATSGTLLTHFSQLNILPAYPDNLVKLRSPSLAVGSPSGLGTSELYYGERAQDQELLLELFGFVLGQGSDHSNRLYRDRLANDVFWLFDTLGRSEGIPLYDSSSQDEVGQVEVTAARLRMLPGTVPSVEADRFKFIVELEITYGAELVD